MSEVAKRIEIKSGRSKVWLYFGHLIVNNVKINDNLVHCNECLKNDESYNCPQNTTISNLKYHLRKRHNIELTEVSDAEKKLTNLQTKKLSSLPTSQRKGLLARRTALWMCRSLRPAQMFKDNAFLDWAVSNGGVERKEDFPSVSYITGSAMNDIYVCLKEKLIQSLMRAPPVINVMLDMWTDNYTKIPYINVSIQFLGNDFDFQTFRLSTQLFDHPHTAQKVASMLTSILTNFQFDDRKFFLSGDGGRNVVASPQYLDNCLGYFKCIAYSFHTILTADWSKMEDYENVSEVLRKIKRTHSKLVYKTKDLRKAYEDLQRLDVIKYLEEWEEGLTEAIQADECIKMSFAEEQVFPFITLLNHLSAVVMRIKRATLTLM
jgi:BED zinc finger